MRMSSTIHGLCVSLWVLAQITKSHPIHIRNDDCKKRKKVVKVWESV